MIVNWMMMLITLMTKRIFIQNIYTYLIYKIYIIYLVYLYIIY